MRTVSSRAAVASRRAAAAAIAAAGLLAGGIEIRAQRAGAGPSRIKIAAGLVTAEETRAGLVGTWEPDADLGLPPGSNHTIYWEDGLYSNPFRNVALIGFWTATANSLTMTPIEIRNLDTTSLVPELKDVFSQIAWDKPGTAVLEWLTPDRYHEKGQREPRRRTNPVHDVTRLHAAIVTDLLSGSWLHGRSIESSFLPGGTFREQMSGAVLAPDALDAAQLRVTVTGTYSVDGGAGVVRCVVEGVDSIGPGVLPLVRNQILNAGRANGVLRVGARLPSSLRWISRNELSVDGEAWQRR